MKCCYPACLQDATHWVHYWRRREVWMIYKVYRKPAPVRHSYCRWHAVVKAVLRNARAPVAKPEGGPGG